MSDLSERTYRLQRVIGPFTILAVVLGIIGLPIAVWLDLRGLTEDNLTLQARQTGHIIDEMRGFYASEVVDRVLKADQRITATHQFRTTPNSIPIPATLSLELGRLISANNDSVKYRFVSDLPFASRPPHDLDPFESTALANLRAAAAAKRPLEPISEDTGLLLDRQVRLVSAITMGPVCVACHNSHPESPKRDWKVGDVRGIQEITIRQPIGTNIFAFRHLLTYLGLSALAGIVLVMLQRRQAFLVSSINRELSESNNFLATISTKIARYLSPQVYKSIFSGTKDVAITTERKKLTIFFSDLKDFAATTERLQPEELTTLLNEYLTEMSTIALVHGATVDKFIGDAILAFFGDPETKGVKEDAVACIRMALAMQKRLLNLNLTWHQRGIEKPVEARMGINTGYCNVGNFGSDDRMDYTIIGAEANLAARLQSIAEPGGITVSYETYALVRDVVEAEAQSPISMKGISRQIVPSTIRGFADGSTRAVLAEHGAGLDLYLDADAMEDKDLDRARSKLAEALRLLERKAHAKAGFRSSPQPT